MLEALPFLITGIVFGLVAGISPGPLLTLVISQTLKHNRKEGILVALAPLLTDLPIVLVTVFIIAKVSSSDIILGIIALLGAIFLLYLGYESVTIKGISVNQEAGQSLKKGIIANFLSPHPYLFWIAVGAPTVLKAYKVSVMASVLFIIGFYVFLVGSKVAVACITEKSKDVLKSSAYVTIIKILGIVLFIFAILFVRDGLKLLGIL